MDSKKVKREIIGLALLLEEVSDLTVFVDYAGHVQSLTVRVYQNHDQEDQSLLLRDSFYMGFKLATKSNYNNIKNFLTEQIEKATAIL